MRLFTTATGFCVVMAAITVAGCESRGPEAATDTAPMESTVTEATEDATADASELSFANKSCPIMGGDLDPELTRQWNGKTIGFCCDGCPEEWDALSEEEKAEKFAEASEAPEAHVHGDHDHGDHDHGDHDHGDHDHAPASEASQSGAGA